MRTPLRPLLAIARLAAILALPAACGDDPTSVNPSPTISQLSPGGVERRAPETVLTVTGSRFVSGSLVRFNGEDRSTRFVSRSELKATLPASDLENPGVARIEVVNPPPGGGTSNAVSFAVTVRPLPAPSISGFSPEFLVAGAGQQTVAINGEGFAPESRVTMLGGRVDFEFQSDKRIRIVVEAGLTAASGRLPIRITNPAPGGGLSNLDTLEVRSRVPEIGSVSPAAAFVGEDGLVLRVTGSGFVANTEVLFSGAARQTRVLGHDALEATLLGADLRSAGTYKISVRNPAPGGGTSGLLDLTLTNGRPQVDFLSSRGGSAGRTGFRLFIHGRAFAEGVRVRWNGVDRGTSYFGPRLITAQLTSADLATPGTATVTVHNPEPAGGASDPITFTIRAVPAATGTTRTVALGARDLVYDPRTERLYASIPGSAASHANSVVVIDPASGAVTRSIPVGSEPNRLALSRDGQFLYVGLDGANAVRRIELSTLTPGLQWSLGEGAVAGDIEVAPGAPRTVAVARHRPDSFGPPPLGITIYDDGTPRLLSSDGRGAGRIEFGESASVLYGYGDLRSSVYLYSYVLAPNGIFPTGLHDDLLTGAYTEIVGAAGRIYGTTGQVIDPDRSVNLGRFAGSGYAVAVSPELGRAFMLTSTAIRVFDLNTFESLGEFAIPAPSFEDSERARPRLVLWGSDGLAFLDRDELFLIRTPLAAR